MVGRSANTSGHRAPTSVKKKKGSSGSASHHRVEAVEAVEESREKESDTPHDAPQRIGNDTPGSRFLFVKRQAQKPLQ